MPALFALLVACAVEPASPHLLEGQLPPPAAIEVVLPLEVSPGESFAVDVTLPVPLDGIDVRLVFGAGVGAGACPAVLHGDCVGVTDRIEVTPAVSTVQGQATVWLTAPPTVAPGDTLAVQAVVVRPNRAYLSPVGTLTVAGGDADGDGVPDEKDAGWVTVGEDMACVALETGEPVCWGADQHGQGSPPDDTFTSLSAGIYLTCGVTTSGFLDCWGSGADDLLAHPWAADPIERVDVWATAVCTIAASTGPDAGLARCWGPDPFGDLAEVDTTLGVATTHDPFREMACSTGWECCGILEGTATGSTGSQAEGEVVCWNALGGGTVFTAGSDAAVPAFAAPFHGLDMGTFRSCVIRDADQSLACWGFVATTELDPVPAGAFVDVAVGAHDACAVRSDGELVCWGSNAFGQHDTLPAGPFASVSTDGENACALRPSGAVVCWGRDDTGVAADAPM